MMVARLPEGEREWKEEGEMEAVEGQPRKEVSVSTQRLDGGFKEGLFICFITLFP
jgi:hypothetical protein